MAEIAHSLKPGSKTILKDPCRLGHGGQRRAPLVRLAILRLATGELQALASVSHPRQALARYIGVPALRAPSASG